MPLAEKLPLDDEQTLEEVETDAVVESVLHPDGELDEECVPLTVGVSETVPQDDAV